MMMLNYDWFLKFELPVFSNPQPLATKVFALGSCFAREMAQKAHSLYLPFQFDPYGLSFDPFSLSLRLRIFENGKGMRPSFKSGDLYMNYDAHGALSHPNEEEHTKQMEHALQMGAQSFNESEGLIVTLGTARTYLEKASGMPATNCHKQAASLFDWRLSQSEALYNSLMPPLLNWLAQNPKRFVVFSVSPVRYVREGLVENNRSKARLIELAHSLCENLPNANYFPAYELLIDVLRDYRFYATDRVHPSTEAIDHISRLFFNWFYNQDATLELVELQKLANWEAHRSLHPDTTAHSKMLENRQRLKESLRQKHPNLNWH